MVWPQEWRAEAGRAQRIAPASGKQSNHQTHSTVLGTQRAQARAMAPFGKKKKKNYPCQKLTPECITFYKVIP